MLMLSAAASAPSAPPAAGPFPSIQIGKAMQSRAFRTMLFQTGLRYAGYGQVVVDGVVGPSTLAAFTKVLGALGWSADKAGDKLDDILKTGGPMIPEKKVRTFFVVMRELLTRGLTARGENPEAWVAIPEFDSGSKHKRA